MFRIENAPLCSAAARSRNGNGGVITYDARESGTCGATDPPWWPRPRTQSSARATNESGVEQRLALDRAPSKLAHKPFSEFYSMKIYYFFREKVLDQMARNMQINYV